MPTDLAAQLGVSKPSDNEALKIQCDALRTAIQKLLVNHIKPIDLVTVRYGLVQLLLVDVIKDHPGCPCTVITDLVQWMGTVAANERFDHDFQLGLMIGDHDDHEGPHG